MHITPDVIIAVCAVIGVVCTMVAWIWERSRKEQKLQSALDENTKATLDVASGLRDFKDVIVSEITDLKIRMALMESKVN